jgi:hypothetical protein
LEIGPGFACGFPNSIFVRLHKEIMQAAVIQNHDNENVRNIERKKRKKERKSLSSLGIL